MPLRHPGVLPPLTFPLFVRAGYRHRGAWNFVAVRMGFVVLPVLEHPLGPGTAPALSRCATSHRWSRFRDAIPSAQLALQLALVAFVLPLRRRVMAPLPAAWRAQPRGAAT